MKDNETEDKKYELVGDGHGKLGVLLHRIRAKRDIPAHGVKVGDLGGWVQGEANLSQYGDCWVADDASVFGKAVVKGDAVVKGRARVYGEATVGGNACVCGCATVWCSATVTGCAIVKDQAEIAGSATVGEDEDRVQCVVEDCAKVMHDAFVYGGSVVGGFAVVGGSAQLDGARIGGMLCVLDGLLKDDSPLVTVSPVPLAGRSGSLTANRQTGSVAYREGGTVRSFNSPGLFAAECIAQDGVAGFIDGGAAAALRALEEMVKGAKA